MSFVVALWSVCDVGFFLVLLCRCVRVFVVFLALFVGMCFLYWGLHGYFVGVCICPLVLARVLFGRCVVCFL